MIETKVLLVDDHPVFRKGLRALLEEEEDVTVIGDAGDGKAAIKATRDLLPDLVIMDITMPGLNGIEATRQIVSEFPDTKVIALSIHSGRRFVQDMLQAGAAGYILKESAPEDLVCGVRAVMRGETFLSSTITGIVVSQYVDVLSNIGSATERIKLTAREKDVLRSTIDGQSRGEMAAALQMSDGSLDSAQGRIMKKLGVETVSELAEYARDNEWIGHEILPAPTDRRVTGGENQLDRTVRTKLRRPALTPDYVHRPRLLELLQRNGTRPFTLISAPAGYGKSTLASSWLEGCESRSAWLSLDEDDNNLRTFTGGVVDAMETIFPGVWKETRALLDAPCLPPLSIVANTLLDEMDQIGNHFILVLDDYQNIAETAIHDLLAALLRHPPRTMHLVLTTRRDPPLPLASLRASGQLSEIATRHLRFTVADTAALLQKTLQIPLDNPMAGVLEKKMEGWVTGLRLTTLSVRNSEDLDRVVTSLPGGFHYITEYLLAEVLAQQPQAIVRYLMNTSILDRFCPALCDAVNTPEEGSWKAADGFSGQQFIDWLEEAKLFVICMDRNTHWFRYHHLFQQLLQDQLRQSANSESVAALHARASAWFASEGQVKEAITHALAAGDTTAAARIVERNVATAMNTERWHELARWLAKLPRECKERSLKLMLGHAWVLLHQFRLEEVTPVLKRFETHPEHATNDPELSGMGSLLSGNCLFYQGDAAGSLECLETALQLIPEDSGSWVRAEAELFFGLALYLSGEGAAAIKTMSDRIHKLHLRDGMLWSRMVFGLSAMHLLGGDLNQASLEAQRLTTGSQRIGNAFVEAWSFYLRGAVALQCLDLNEARLHLSEVAANRFTLDTRAAVDGMAGLALTYQLMGQQAESDDAITQAVGFAEWTENATVHEVVRSCQARLALLREDHDAAARWQRSYNWNLEGAAMLFFREVPCITNCRVLVATGSQISLQEALEKLECVWKNARTLHFACQMLEVGVLQVIAHYRLGNELQAMQALEEAVAMGMPSGWIRPFVEMGAPMAELLQQLVKSEATEGYIERILSAFGNEMHRTVASTPDVRGTADPIRHPKGILEPLTSREEEVLALLGQRMRDKEIAEKLFVSSETVKSHVKHIYSKLRVSSRREAVARAATLGIIASR